MLKSAILGLFLAMIVVGYSGCGPAAKTDDDHEHHHHHHGEHDVIGPHDGLLIEWGNKHEFHVELVIDRTKQQATIYLLDESLQKPIPIDAKSIFLELRTPKTKLVVNAAPQDGDPAGRASRFVVNDPALAGNERLAGAIGGTANGTAYYRAFDEKDLEKAKTKKAAKAAAKPVDKPPVEPADDKAHKDHKDHDHPGE